MTSRQVFLVTLVCYIVSASLLISSAMNIFGDEATKPKIKYEIADGVLEIWFGHDYTSPICFCEIEASQWLKCQCTNVYAQEINRQL